MPAASVTQSPVFSRRDNTHARITLKSLWRHQQTLTALSVHPLLTARITRTAAELVRCHWKQSAKIFAVKVSQGPPHPTPSPPCPLTLNFWDGPVWVQYGQGTGQYIIKCFFVTVHTESLVTAASVLPQADTPSTGTPAVNVWSVPQR